MAVVRATGVPTPIPTSDRIHFGDEINTHRRAGGHCLIGLQSQFVRVTIRAPALGPKSLNHRSSDHLHAEGRLLVGSAAHTKFPVSLGQCTEDGRIPHGTAKPSLPDGRVLSPPLFCHRSNFELGAVQIRIGEDDSRAHSLTNIDNHCAFTGTGGMFGDRVGVMAHRRRRHEATLGALYPLWGGPRYGKLARYFSVPPTVVSVPPFTRS